MASFEFEVKRSFLIRVKYDYDLIRFVTELAQEKGVAAASFTAMGAVKHAKLGFYDQAKHVYKEMIFDSPLEIASCVGNISVRDGRPFVHAHAVLSDSEGNARAGHLFEATVFAGEVHLFELKGPRLERKHDDVTGLFLWEAEH